MRHLAAIAALALLLLSAPMALARVAFVPLETRVAASSLIVIAKVTAVSEVQLDNAQLTKVEATVSDTLKGTAPKSLTFYITPNPRRVVIPAVKENHIFLLKPKSSDANDKDPLLELAHPFTMFSIVDPKEADQVKKAVAAEKTAQTQP